jgi:aryl-alcohol dehydrogenase-like predicted oxidoreductase
MWEVASTKINYIAISDTPPWIVAEANLMAKHHGWEPFSIYQFPYSIVRRDVERDVIPYCKYHNMAMAPFGVLNGGLYTGKFTRADKDSSGRIASRGTEIPEKALKVARVVDSIADELEVTSAQVATRWTQMIDPDQLTESLASVSVNLTNDHMDQLDGIFREEYGFTHGFHYDWYKGTTQHFFGDLYEQLIHHKEVY